MRKPYSHRRLNFLPPESRPSAFGPGALVALLAALLLGLPLLGAGAKVARWGAERQLASLTAERDSLSAQVAAGMQSHEASADQVAASAVKKALSEKLYWAEVFKELSNVAPKGVWLSTVDASAIEGGKRVVIAGQGISQGEVAEFFARLEKSYYFRHVQMKFTEADGGRADLFRFQFEGNVFDDGKGGRHATN